MDGSKVYSVYYEENDLQRIMEYCQKDVVALIQLMRKYKGQDLIADDFIVEG